MKRMAFPLLGLPGLALVLAAAGAAGPAKPGGQPIAYNHRLHVKDQEISCVTCHRQVETAEVAGRPPLAVCLECHEAAITDNPEEHKIQEYAAAGTEIPWVRVTWLPSHVYFSHRRHVAVAGLACATCHGPMEERTTPPERPLRSLSMSMCLDCHEKSEASLDCNACHR